MSIKKPKESQNGRPEKRLERKFIWFFYGGRFADKLRNGATNDLLDGITIKA